MINILGASFPLLLCTLRLLSRFFINMYFYYLIKLLPFHNSPFSDNKCPETRNQKKIYHKQQKCFVKKAVSTMKNSCCRSGWESLEGHQAPEKDFANLPLKLQLFYNKDLILRWCRLYTITY